MYDGTWRCEFSYALKVDLELLSRILRAGAFLMRGPRKGLLFGARVKTGKKGMVIMIADWRRDKKRF
jgi:hypothetical protein